MHRLFLTLVASLSLSAISAYAASPTPPSLKPERVYTSDVTDAANAEILEKALRAAEASQWGRMRSLQNQAGDPIVRDLIRWKRASAGVPGMGFDELSSVLNDLPDWPDQTRIQKRAEEIIDESTLSPKDRIDWLEAHNVRTGAGKIALANAWRKIGEPEKAAEIVRDVWRHHSLPRDLANTTIATYGYALSQDDHEARADFLLWTNQRTAAYRLKPKLSKGWQRLVDARIALAARGRGVDAKIKAVPASLQDNPGLLYERARWRRKRGNQAGATPLLVKINGLDVPAAGRGKLWDERNIALRRELKEGSRKTAYQLAAPHGMSSGADFAAAEWVAGWIALRLTHQPEQALKHFSTLENGVSTPISLARAAYWKGRTLDVLDKREEALAAYEAAARHKFTYYGQLAAERLNDRELDLGEDVQPTEEERESFEANRLVKALRLLGETGNTRLFRKFAYHLDDQLASPAEYTMLAELAKEYQITDIGVRGAKAGLAKGIISPQAAYPIVDYPLSRQPRVERPLMLALSRQESEMNPRAISGAGARGLMQFMPATARQEARLRGLPYRKSWLTDDPGYNMTLGGAHLDNLLDQFNGSYIMTAAAYNAGGRRPKAWVLDYGDPRRGEIDPVDWVEFIPFSETRNYVQRVLENIQVYRYRITGRETDIRLQEDLERGRF